MLKRLCLREGFLSAGNNNVSATDIAQDFHLIEAGKINVQIILVECQISMFHEIRMFR